VVAIFDPALYENFTIEKEWVRLRAKNALLWVNRGRTGLASTVLVAGSVGALMSLAPPAVAAATAAATTAAAGLGAAAASDVRIRHHRDTRIHLRNLFITQS
jgi:hypothetical protein